jgi:hypothetical protein
MDACFRLKRCMASSHAKDPSLSEGSAYFVEESSYRKHLLKYTDQVEVGVLTSLVLKRADASIDEHMQRPLSARSREHQILPRIF